VPSRLVPSHPGFQAQQLAKARELTHLSGVAARGPFLGYVPDLPAHHLDMNAASGIIGLVARSLVTGGSDGEVLMLDMGWRRASEADPSLDMPLSGGSQEVVHITMFPRTNPDGDKTGEYQNTIMAVVAGDGSTENTCELWRLLPSTNAWTQIAHTNYGPNDTYRPEGDRDALPDSCVLASGWPDRDTDLVFSGNDAAADGIDEPCFVWTNNVDPVYVFPADSDTAALNDEFEDLTSASTLWTTNDKTKAFKAKSCEAFNNRIYFLNTSEKGVRYRQRLRRTPPFTANPDPAQVGAGSSDLKDFAGDGLRAERLGNVLALYFEDGVAFMRPTQVRTAPDSFQTISTSRGLVSTHAVTNIGNDLHFGIFNDGWFELDPSGRFREVGIANIGGIPHHKWKDTFYAALAKDKTKRARLYTQYHPDTNSIYISVPLDSATDNAVVWIYDRTSDRVFLDNYGATCWGVIDRITDPTGTTIGGLTGTIGGLSGSIVDLGIKSGIQDLAHGTTSGYIFQHDIGLSTRDKEQTTGNSLPLYNYLTPQIAGSSPRFLMSLDRFIVEYISVGSTDMSVTVKANAQSQVANVPINDGVFGSVNTGQGWFRITGQEFSVSLTGTGPVMLKSFEADIYEEQVEPR